MVKKLVVAPAAHSQLPGGLSQARHYTALARSSIRRFVSRNEYFKRREFVKEASGWVKDACRERGGSPQRPERHRGGTKGISLCPLCASVMKIDLSNSQLEREKGSPEEAQSALNRNLYGECRSEAV